MHMGLMSDAQVPPAGMWSKELVGLDRGSREMVLMHHPPVPPSHPNTQQRRASHHHLFHGASGSMGRQGQLYAEGKGGGGRIEGTGAYKNQSQTPQFTALPNIPPPLPPTTPRTETIKWAVIRITN
ncbi:hypothetical protein BGZ98_009088, partial [Dissophora globulifera]